MLAHFRSKFLPNLSLVENLTTPQTTIHIFEAEDSFTHIRSTMIDNEPWFFAKDVCEALGIGNTSSAVSVLAEDEKAITKTATLGGPQQTLILNESGLYTIMLRSHEALKVGSTAYNFRRWITGEVLPDIRRTGSYVAVAPKAIPAKAPLKVNVVKPSGALIREMGRTFVMLTEAFAMSANAKQTLATSMYGQVGFAVPEPVVRDGRHYATTELADELERHPSTVGKKVKHLKTDENGETRLTMVNGSHREQWYWNDRGRAAVLAFFDEIA